MQITCARFVIMSTSSRIPSCVFYFHAMHVQCMQLLSVGHLSEKWNCEVKLVFTGGAEESPIRTLGIFDSSMTKSVRSTFIIHKESRRAESLKKY